MSCLNPHKKSRSRQRSGTYSEEGTSSGRKGCCLLSQEPEVQGAEATAASQRRRHRKRAGPAAEPTRGNRMNSCFILGQVGDSKLQELCCPCEVTAWILAAFLGAQKGRSCCPQALPSPPLSLLWILPSSIWPSS